MPTKEDDVLKQRQAASVLEHQMALRQLLLRFWVTDHGDCHFREESLEKVTFLTSNSREFTEFTEFTRWAGLRAARCIPEHILQLDWGVLNMAPMANGRHASFN